MTIPPLEAFVEATLLLLVLLNPFLVVVYLVDLMRSMQLRRFSSVLFKAGVITSVVFVVFALLGGVELHIRLFSLTFAGLLDDLQDLLARFGPGAHGLAAGLVGRSVGVLAHGLGVAVLFGVIAVHGGVFDAGVHGVAGHPVLRGLSAVTARGEAQGQNGGGGGQAKA